MNIFVLNTGRCGSVTFIQACRHIKNFSCAHESRTHLLGDERLNYPKNHIEADNRLSWFLGRINIKYGKNAIYVHLKRKNDDVAKSFLKRYSSGIIQAYRGSGILLGLPKTEQPINVCLDYCYTVNSNIEMFLNDKPYKIDIDLNNIKQDFVTFFNYIKAAGDLNSALKEFDVMYNASQNDEMQSLLIQRNNKKSILKYFRKIQRVALKLPAFLKDA